MARVVQTNGVVEGDVRLHGAARTEGRAPSASDQYSESISKKVCDLLRFPFRDGT